MIGYIFGTLIGGTILLLVLAWVIYLIIKNRGFKRHIKQIGQKAEQKINADLKIWAKKTNNIFIPNSLYSYNGNMVFEVDSILVTDKALIVIEIKSIKGGIRGDAQSMSWKKVLGDVEHPISNPVLQNEKHIEHITRMTKTKVPTISLIIYSDRSTFIDVKNLPYHAAVIRHSSLFDILDKINEKLPVKMNEYEIKTLASNIKKFRTNKSKDIRLHKNITTRGRA